MQKLLIAMTAASAIAVAAPAAAQSGNAWGTQANVNANVGANLDGRIAQLETRLQAGIQSGAIDRTEARNLRMQVRQLRQLQYRYSANGLSQQERMDLQQRLRTLRQQFRVADGGGNGRWADNDYDDYNNGYGGNNGYNGRGGVYEEVQGCDNRSGNRIGNVINGILGGGSTGCAGVGQRAPGNLGAVPYELRGQFRDGNGIVYRSDGERIFQIDARTNTVLRVYTSNR
ncbi:MAG: hypothetical protein QOI38_1047 [Sphingomonadales bacterium]|jgi:hypothetical protein|nr:hypothetical protein [Sphingomonadales bacterium]